MRIIILLLTSVCLSGVAQAQSMVDRFFNSEQRPAASRLEDERLKTAQLFNLARIDPWKRVAVVGDENGYYHQTIDEFSRMLKNSASGKVMASSVSPGKKLLKSRGSETASTTNNDLYIEGADAVVGVASKSFVDASASEFFTRSFLSLKEGGVLMVAVETDRLDGNEKASDFSYRLAAIAEEMGFYAVEVLYQGRVAPKSGGAKVDKEVPNELYFLRAVKQEKIEVAEYIAW